MVSGISYKWDVWNRDYRVIGYRAWSAPSQPSTRERMAKSKIDDSVMSLAVLWEKRKKKKEKKKEPLRVEWQLAMVPRRAVAQAW